MFWLYSKLLERAIPLAFTPLVSDLKSPPTRPSSCPWPSHTTQRSLLLLRLRARGERLHLRFEVLVVAGAQELRLLRGEVRVRGLVLREVQLLSPK